MGEKVVQAAMDVAAVAREFADAGERARRLSPEVLTALADTDLLRMAVPAALGGPEVDPVTSAKAIMAVAEGDAAAAWYPAVSSANSMFSHHLAEDAAREIFCGTAPVGSSGMPNGSGRFVDGGLCVESGRWPWGSAGVVAAWMGIGMVVEARMLLAFVPAEDYVVHDNWDSFGLAATASGDFSVRPGTFVPTNRMVDTSLRMPVIDTPLSRFPANVYANFGFAAVAVGNALGAVDELVALASGQRSLGTSGPIADAPLTHIDLARAEARLRSARAFLLEALEELWDRTVAGEDIGVHERATARLAMCHATGECAAVIDTVHALGGGAAVRSSNPLQKRLRDAHVITQQVHVSGKVYPLYGQMRLGHALESFAWQLLT